MRKSIFSKLILIFVVTLLVSFSVSGISLFFFLNKYISEDTVRNLEISADRINEAFNDYLEFRKSYLLENTDNVLLQRTLQRYFLNTIEAESNISNAYIWLVNSEGYINPDFSTLPEGVPVQLSNGLKLPDERQYKKLFSGENRSIIEKGSFYGLFKKTGWSWLTVAKPLKYKAAGSEETGLAIYLNVPIRQVNRTRTDVLRYFIISILVSIPVSAVLVYFLSIRITRPLKEIKDAAKVIAAGEFHSRLDIASQDEIGQLASSFNQMVAALENLEEMRRGFIANVSHELRTPMTSIRGFIEGILDGTIPQSRQKDYLMIVRDEVNRLNRLVNDLLDLARMEAGEMKLSIKEFNINELIRRSIIKLENIILEKQLNIEADFHEEEVFVNADPDAIERVVLNLLHNAIKFTPPNGTITLSTLKQKDRVSVSVKDTGIGIEPEELDLIWDRFYKTDRSRSRDKTGTGLGLAIVRNIINEHNGEIRVESEPGTGTIFTFDIFTGHS